MLNASITTAASRAPRLWQSEPQAHRGRVAGESLARPGVLASAPTTCICVSTDFSEHTGRVGRKGHRGLHWMNRRHSNVRSKTFISDTLSQQLACHPTECLEQPLSLCTKVVVAPRHFGSAFPMSLLGITLWWPVAGTAAWQRGCRLLLLFLGIPSTAPRSRRRLSLHSQSYPALDK